MKPTLKEWHITKFHKPNGVAYYAYGTVYGHKSWKCADGTFIHTSHIESITLPDKDTLELQTRNTVYSLKLNEYGTVLDIANPVAGSEYTRSNGDNTADALEFFGVPADIYSAMTALRKERFDQRNAYVESCGAKLAEGETYLALSDSADCYFDFGITKQSGKIDILQKNVHVGTFMDSVLVGLVTRYHPFAARSLEFYEDLYSKRNNIGVGTRLGYLKNTGKVTLYIRFSWNKCVTLNPDEEIEVRYKETGIEEP